MVVARKSRKQTNHRMFVFCGGEVVRSDSRKLAVLLDIGRTPAVRKFECRLIDADFEKPMLQAWDV